MAEGMERLGARDDGRAHIPLSQPNMNAAPMLASNVLPYARDWMAAPGCVSGQLAGPLVHSAATNAKMNANMNMNMNGAAMPGGPQEMLAASKQIASRTSAPTIGAPLQMSQGMPTKSTPTPGGAPAIGAGMAMMTFQQSQSQGQGQVRPVQQTDVAILLQTGMRTHNVDIFIPVNSLLDLESNAKNREHHINLGLAPGENVVGAVITKLTLESDTSNTPVPLMVDIEGTTSSRTNSLLGVRYGFQPRTGGRGQPHPRGTVLHETKDIGNPSHMQRWGHIRDIDEAMRGTIAETHTNTMYVPFETCIGSVLDRTATRDRSVGIKWECQESPIGAGQGQGQGQGQGVWFTRIPLQDGERLRDRLKEEIFNVRSNTDLRNLRAKIKGRMDGRAWTAPTTADENAQDPELLQALISSSFTIQASIQLEVWCPGDNCK